MNIDTSPCELYGCKVIINNNMVIEGKRETHYRKRTITERLFSLPWKPFEALASYTYTPKIPSTEVFVLDHGKTLVMHQHTYESLKSSFNNIKNSLEPKLFY